MEIPRWVGQLYEQVRRRKQSYLQFKGIGGAAFFADLANFCCANAVEIVKDEQGRLDKDAMLILVGRREVWLRIQNHFNLTSQQLLAIQLGKDYFQEEEQVDGR